MNKLASSLSLAVSLITLTCAAHASNGGERNGTGNPADQNCTALEGTIREVATPGGETGFCVIDEWKLFEAMEAKGLVKAHTYGQGGMPNPAAVNCADIEGSLEEQSTPAGDEGVCVVDAWKLFQVIDVVTKP